MSTTLIVITVISQVALVVSVVGLVWLGRKPKPKATGRQEDVISIKKLMAVSGFTEPRDLVDDALNFYDFMTEQAMKGNLVGYMDKDKQFTQVLTKGMRWAKDVGRVTGAGEAT